MIFIWTSNGGPLQYVGLAIFLVQFMPYILDEFSERFNLSIELILAIVASLVIAAIFFAWRVGTFGRLADSTMRAIAEATDVVRRYTGVSGTGGMIFLMGLAVLTFSALFIFCDAFMLSSLFHIIGVCLILRANLRGGGERGNDRSSDGRGTEGREAKLTEIVRVIQKMPLEEFIPEEDIARECTVSQLKKMLKVRDQRIEEGTCIERSDLVEAVKKCRNYCDTCCICCEEYIKGDPLRVLPRCRHEFHVECLDQWAYTFANKAKRQRDPSCPLCNEAMK